MALGRGKKVRKTRTQREARALNVNQIWFFTFFFFSFIVIFFTTHYQYICWQVCKIVSMSRDSGFWWVFFLPFQYSSEIIHCEYQL